MDYDDVERFDDGAFDPELTEKEKKSLEEQEGEKKEGRGERDYQYNIEK